MPMLPFQQVDVFTSVPFMGNPVAVILDGDALAAEEMQRIARWTNLSETTFVCSPTDPAADYRLRIFTPGNELPFAGHPTLGSAHAVLRHGQEPKTPGRLVQECGKGLVQIESDGDRGFFFALPRPRFVDGGDRLQAGLAHALGVAASDVRSASPVDVGPVWLTVELPSAESVLALRPDMDKISSLMPDGWTGVTVFGLNRGDDGADVEVRSFAPGEGVPEDPVCGSGNGCVAAVVRQRSLLAKRDYLARQGRCLGRDGRVAIRFADDDTIWVGGQAVTCVEGTLKPPGES
jgi:PhzF family phenazine biosynthesis protein